MPQRNKEKHTRVSTALFSEGDGTYVKEQPLCQCVYYWWLKKQGRAAHWSSRGLWRKSLLVLSSFMSWLEMVNSVDPNEIKKIARMLWRRERTCHNERTSTAVLIQPRWPTKNITWTIARKHACAYHNTNAAGTACWRSLVNTCRRTVSQICLLFYIGV